MDITVTKTEKPDPFTTLHLDGTLDGANFQTLIDEATKLHAGGVRDLILDLEKLSFISSAGLRALLQVAQLFQGKKHSKENDGWGGYRWAAYRSMDRDQQGKPQEHVKLLSPSKEVRELLDMIGFTSLFEIYSDFPLAVASFHQAVPA